MKEERKELAATYLEHAERKEFRGGSNVASDPDNSSVGASDEVDRLNRVSRVIDPVQTSSDVVDRQS